MQITQEEINAHWTEGAENYSDIIDQELASFRAERWKRKILENAPRKERLDILDIGCGPGFFSILLAEEGHRVTGIDGSGAMLREAEAKAARRRETREAAVREAPGPATAPVFRQMDAHHLEFLDHSFDLLVSRNVTHTLAGSPHRLPRVAAGAAAGGVLLIFDANWHLVKADPALQEDSRRRYEACVRKYGDAFDRKHAQQGRTAAAGLGGGTRAGGSAAAGLGYGAAAGPWLHRHPDGAGFDGGNVG